MLELNESSRERVRRMLTPRSIALVGASERNFFSRQILENLRRHEYGGRVFPINPRSTEVDGLRTYPSLDDVPEAPDLVLVATPRGTVPGIVTAAGSRGAGGVVVISTGFGENNDEAGAAVERQVLTSVPGMPILGPNTIGLVNMAARFCAMGTPVPWPLEVGSTALIMQSGGLLTGSLAALAHHGVGVGYAISLGNSRGTDAATWIDAIADDDRITTIGLLLESLPQWERLRAAADRAAARGKRLYAVKVGRSATGAAATASHTGALAGDYAVSHDLLAQLGIGQAASLEGLLTAVELSAVAGPPRGTNVAMMGASGGVCGSFADLANDRGVALKPFSSDTRAELAAVADTFTPVNPLDLGGQVMADATMLTRAVDAILSDPDTAIGVYIPSLGLPGPELPDLHEMMKLVADAARSGSTPVIGTQMTFSPSTNAVIEQYRQGGLFRVASSVHALLDGIAAWMGPVPGDAREAPQRGTTGATALSESAGKAALRAGGVPVPRGRSFPPGEPVEVDFFPVVVKGLCTGVLHKSRAGLVELDVAGRESLDRAIERLRRAARDRGLHLEEILVEEMVAPGTDLFVSVSRAAAGTVLAVGLGGTDVEERHAVRFLGVPFTADELERALAGFPPVGEPVPRDLPGVLARVIAQHAEAGLELLEINPLRVTENGCFALDAVCVPRETGMGR